MDYSYAAPYYHPQQIQYYPPIHYPPPPPPVEGAWGSAVTHYHPPPVEMAWGSAVTHGPPPTIEGAWGTRGPPPPDIFKLGISPFYFDTISHKSGHPVHYLPIALEDKLPLIVIAEALGYNDWDTMYSVLRAFNINVNTPLSGSLTLIWYASRDGKFNIVQNLLLLGANPNVFDVTSQEGPLDMALRKRFNRLEHLLKAYKAIRCPKKKALPPTEVPIATEE